MKLELLLILVLTAATQGADAPKSWAADHAGPAPDRKDGSCFEWRIVR